MKIELFGKNYNPSEDLIKITDKKCEKLARRLKADPDAVVKITVTLEGNNYTTDAVVLTKGFEYRASVVGADPFTNLDDIVPKIIGQMDKQKTVWDKSKKGSPNEYPVEEDIDEK